MRHKALRRTIAVRLCHKSIRMGSAPIGINVYSHLGDGELFTKRQSSLSPTRGTSFDRMALERRFERLVRWSIFRGYRTEFVGRISFVRYFRGSSV